MNEVRDKVWKPKPLPRKVELVRKFGRDIYWSDGLREQRLELELDTHIITKMNKIPELWEKAAAKAKGEDSLP